MGSIKSIMILCWWVLNVAAFDLVDAKAGSSDCVPSSCGHIHEIRNPFRLKQDPQHCGRSAFTLYCENNVTILDLQSLGKFYVQEINYTSHTIRAVDPSIQNNNGSSIPSYSFTSYGSYPFYVNFISKTFQDCIPRQNKSAGGAGSTCGGGTYPIYFLKCTNPVKSSVYLDTSPCYNSQPNSHGYVKVNDMVVGELKDGCSVERMTVVYLADDWDSSCKYIQNALLSGFEITYYDDITICGEDHWVDNRGSTGITKNGRTNYTEFWSVNQQCFGKNFTGI
ncbi:hypothetical protein M0R45_035828 [Rubus argutus]|uniref:Wall-associated receptor kinase galacturonan-binding domain-containing protein n=1 Tax=Rubus argutus TaxID=59490 RepID=A0AAW1VZJ0_RUBAR